MRSIKKNDNRMNGSAADVTNDKSDATGSTSYSENDKHSKRWVASNACRDVGPIHPPDRRRRRYAVGCSD